MASRSAPVSGGPLDDESRDITATSVGEKFAVRSESDIVDVTYRNGELRVSVDTVAVSGKPVTIEYSFAGPRGFRLLDDGDLIRYWEQKVFEPGYHLFQITSGGWAAQEVSLAGMLSVSDAVGTKEWFVAATTNQCMNILAAHQPTSSVAVV